MSRYEEMMKLNDELDARREAGLLVTIRTSSAGCAHNYSKKAELASVRRMKELGGKVEFISDKTIEVAFDNPTNADRFATWCRANGFVIS